MGLRRHRFRRNRRRLFTMPYRQERITKNKERRARAMCDPTRPPLGKGRSKEWSKNQNPPSIPPLVRGDKEGLLMSDERRETLYILCIILFAICYLLFASVGEAKMKGRCKDCHSMHASTPFPVLTKGGCVGCHGQVPDGTQDIITIGKVRIQRELHHMGEGDLASGNFYYVADGYSPDYFKGHNVLGISHQESIPTMNVPPGFIGNVVIPGGKGPVYWPPET